MILKGNRLKKKLLIILLCFSAFSFIYAQSIVVKSLNAFERNNNTSFPVLTSNEPLIIEFDVKSEFVPDLNIVFRYCDRYWKPTDNIFFQNNGQNIAYFLDYISLPATVEDADYFFSNSFPDKQGYVSFPYSGKWRFYIVDSGDTSKVYADGKFFVVKPEVSIGVSLKREILDDKVYYPPDLGRTVWVTTKTLLSQDFFPQFVDEVEIVQNHLVDNPIRVNRNAPMDFNRLFEWNGDNRLTFIAKDVRPGNGYRQANLMDVNKFTTKNVRAQFEGFETSRFYLTPLPDLDGGKIIKSPKDPLSNYMNVLFSIKPTSDVLGDVYLVGAFNNWELNSKYKMNFDGDLYSLTIPLKRGIYDYQYVVVNGDPKNPENQDWFALEGNNWETTNELNIFLYYRDPQYGGYDKIIGHYRIKTK